MTVTVTTEGPSSFRQIITAGHHTFFTDMNKKDTGQATAPEPHDLLIASWGSCTNMTIQLYAQRKQWPLEKVSTTVQERKENNRLTVINKKIQIWGNLTPDQVAQLKTVAEKCPINQIILKGMSNTQIQSSLELIETKT